MNQIALPTSTPSRWRVFVNAYAEWIFSALTVLLSVPLILAPLPMYVGPALVVFIPAVVAVLLIRLGEGKGQIRQQLFSARAWRTDLKWTAISLGLGIALRLAVSLLGLALVPGYRLQSGPVTPLLLVVFVFAAGEEIGWRGYALPRLLQRGGSPLRAALLLGLPWALIHQALILPGKLAEGVPPVAQFVVILSLSVITTWLYLATKGNILAPVLVHGGQNALSVLNAGLPVAVNNWLMALVYGMVAVLLVVFTRRRLGQDNRAETQK